MAVYPLIKENYRQKDFFEKNYSSRPSITNRYIFFNQVDANIFKYFISKSKIKVFNSKSESRSLTIKKIDRCKIILINGTDHYEANIFLIKDLVKVQNQENVKFEQVYFKPHPRETDKNIELLKLFMKKCRLEKVIFISKKSTLIQLPDYDTVLTAISSSINYYSDQGVLILLSSRASKVGFTEKQYSVYIYALGDMKYKIINKNGDS
jgi:hypothetical protein